MPASPNLRGMARAGYVAGGAGMALWGIFAASAGWAKVIWLVIGGAVIVEGLIGFCLVVRLFERGGKQAGRMHG